MCAGLSIFPRETSGKPNYDSYLHMWNYGIKGIPLDSGDSPGITEAVGEEVGVAAIILLELVVWQQRLKHAALNNTHPFAFAICSN